MFCQIKVPNLKILIVQANVESTKFVQYYCDQILPKWDDFEKLENGKALQDTLLKQLAELSIHCGKLDNASLHVVQIFDKLKVYINLISYKYST